MVEPAQELQEKSRFPAASWRWKVWLTIFWVMSAPGSLTRMKMWIRGRSAKEEGVRCTTVDQLEARRKSVNRGTPIGSEDWTMRITSMLRLEFIFYPHGRYRSEKR